MSTTASKPMSDTPENDPILVIGAGVIGLAIAFRLARRHPNVTLVDRRPHGQETSLGNAGHIATELLRPLASPDTIRSLPRLCFGAWSPLSVRPAYALKALPWLIRFAWACRRSSFEQGANALRSLLSPAMGATASLYADAGIAHLLHQRGHMILFESKRSQAAIEQQKHLFSDVGIDYQWLSRDEVHNHAPQLKRDIHGALRMHGTGHVTNPSAVCDGLYDAFLQAGGRFLEEEVVALDAGRGRQIDVRTTSQTMRARKVVLCAGAWSGILMRQLGTPVPLDTERGYNVTAGGWHPDIDVSIASYERHTIMTPMDVGLRMTGFVEIGGLKLPSNPAKTAMLQRHVRELFPNAEIPAFSEWMGFRPSLPDHLPVIGRLPRYGEVYCAFGHQHLGLTLAAVTAEVIADLISQREPEIDLFPFRPDRF